MKEENGILYFGTDGNGGKFFAVDLSDGRIRYSYPTGGTSNFICYKEYVLLSNDKDTPVLINRKNGVLFQEIEFDDYQITSYQQMMIVEDRLYAIAHKKDAVYAVSVELAET